MRCIRCEEKHWFFVRKNKEEEEDNSGSLGLFTALILLQPRKLFLDRVRKRPVRLTGVTGHPGPREREDSGF